MTNKKITKILFLITLQFIFVSCKKDNTTIKTLPQTKKVEKKQIDFSVKFPDTVYVGEKKDGIIQFKSPLDTIIATFGDKTKNRYARFILTTTKNIDYDFEHLKQTVKDTFGALNNREIPFYEINFKESGTYYIDGIINDIVLISLNKKDNEGNDLSRLIVNEERVTYKVIVINRPAPKSTL